MALRRLLGAGDARAESQSMTRVWQLKKVGSVPGVAWAKVSKPGLGSHTWFTVTREEFDG